jgi:hypothetical protein
MVCSRKVILDFCYENPTNTSERRHKNEAHARAAKDEDVYMI